MLLQIPSLLKWTQTFQMTYWKCKKSSISCRFDNDFFLQSIRTGHLVWLLSIFNDDCSSMAFFWQQMVFCFHIRAALTYTTGMWSPCLSCGQAESQSLQFRRLKPKHLQFLRGNCRCSSLLMQFPPAYPFLFPANVSRPAKQFGLL